MPSRVSSSGYASSRSQRITWTSNPARASVPASFAIRGSRPAGLFERTKTTRPAMSSQERGDLLRDLLPGRAVAERVRPFPFRAELAADRGSDPRRVRPREDVRSDLQGLRALRVLAQGDAGHAEEATFLLESAGICHHDRRDRKSTRLNSSHLVISYAVFCLKKKKNNLPTYITTKKTKTNK